MKSLAQIFFGIFFVLSFGLVLFSSTLKFQILNYKFLTTSFEKHDTYSKLAQIVKNSVNDQIDKSGGNRNDIAMLTDLITKENITDFINKNLFNSLSFVNGKSKELTVYVPVDKVPNDLLPKSIADLNKDMTVTEIATRFNIAGLESLPLTKISQLGQYDYYVLMTSTFLMVLFLILLMLLIEAGQRFIAPGLALILTGSLTLLLANYGRGFSESLPQNITTDSSLNKVIALTVMQPVVTEIVAIWIYVGISLVVLGLLFFFIKTKASDQKIPLVDSPGN